MKAKKQPPKPIHQFQGFMETSLSLGNSIEDIARKIGRSYKETLKYLTEKDLLSKYERRSWTHKSKKKKHKSTKKDPAIKKDKASWPTKCAMYISMKSIYGAPVVREFVPGGLL